MCLCVSKLKLTINLSNIYRKVYTNVHRTSFDGTNSIIPRKSVHKISLDSTNLSNQFWIQYKHTPNQFQQYKWKKTSFYCTNEDKTSLDCTTIQKSSFDITNLHNTSSVSTNVHKSISNLFQNIFLSSSQDLLQCLFLL